jgi:very-long-chain ceramide synthase
LLTWKPADAQTSKTLNYLDHFLTGPYYAFFVFVWIYMRHYLNLRIILSLFNEFKTVGPYEMDWEAGQYKCTLSFAITLALLGSLQCLNLFWLFFIIRIAYRYAVHNIAKDDRSDAEESELEPEVPAHPDVLDKKIKPAALEATPLLSNGSADGAKVTANGSAAKKTAR